MITPVQMRAARAMLSLSQGDVAKSLGIAANTLSNIESGQSDAPVSRLKEIQDYYESQGIEFTATGVQTKKHSVRVLEGAKGFLDFYDEVYWTVKNSSNKEIFVSNVDERKFVEWQKDQLAEHTQRMLDLGVHYKILIEHGDTFFPASSYAEYRWMPKGLFFSVPYYTYGEKLAMMIFENEPRIYILDEREISLSYRRQFEHLWTISQEPVNE